jgi:lysozyme family protein
MFDMPNMQAFGQAVISLTHSYWPRDDVDVLSTIRDDEVVDSSVNKPSFHDLSMLDPRE